MTTQEQSSENIDSNDGIANETTSSEHQEILMIATLQMINFQMVQKAKLKLNQLQMKINRLQKFNNQQLQVHHQVMSLICLLIPNEGREIKDTPLTRPTEEPATSSEPVTTNPSSDSVNVTQPVTTSSSSDSVPLVQAPVHHHLRFRFNNLVFLKFQLVQPPITSSATETITLEPITKILNL